MRSVVSRGFTLLEALVGVLILGFLLVGLAGGARFGAGAAIRQGQSSDRSGDLDAVDRALRQIIASADPAAPMTGTAGTLAFVGELPNAPGPNTVALGLDASRRLVMRWTPKAPGRPLVPLVAQQAELLTGVAGITFSYYAPATDTGTGTDPVAAWQTAWSRNTLPLLIRLRIALADPAAPHWPDIVVAPKRRG
jgi:general secretion pathway protein J